MPTITQTHATSDQEVSSRNMEGRMVEIEEVMRKLIAQLEAVWKENEVLKVKNSPSGED